MFHACLRRVRAACAVALTAVAGTTVALAAPPNDDIADATPIPESGIVATGFMASATTSPSDPSCGTPVHQSVWYRYTWSSTRRPARPTTSRSIRRPRAARRR